MDPFLPVSVNGGPISKELLEEKAAERQLPLGTEQRRDSQGQFLSHKDVPDRNVADSFPR